MLQTAFSVVSLQKIMLSNFYKNFDVWAVRNSILIYDVIKNRKKFFFKTLASYILTDAEWPPES